MPLAMSKVQSNIYSGVKAFRWLVAFSRLVACYQSESLWKGMGIYLEQSTTNLKHQLLAIVGSKKKETAG